MHQSIITWKSWVSIDLFLMLPGLKQLSYHYFGFRKPWVRSVPHSWFLFQLAFPFSLAYWFLVSILRFLIQSRSCPPSLPTTSLSQFSPAFSSSSDFSVFPPSKWLPLTPFLSPAPSPNLLVLHPQLPWPVSFPSPS